MVEIRLELYNDKKRVLLHEMDRRLLLIGSNPECDLCVPSDDVAHIQCLLRREGSALYLANRAAEGTRVGEEAVDDETRLADGDTIVLGPVRAIVRFHDDGREAAAVTKTLTEDEREPAMFRLVSVAQGEQWALDENGLKLGSAESNDVIIDDPYASSAHARVAIEGGRVMVRDLNSRNGLFVDEAKLEVGEARNGSTIRVGTTEFRVEQVTSRPERFSLMQKSALSAWVGHSPVSDRVRSLAARLAQNNAPVLITGETGAGKEVVAGMLHRASQRASGPLVAINCGALTRSLIESELFGHEKGAFTGATGRKQGAFESASGGTLFLDEIGELPIDLQPQLLRVLENQEVRRVGGTESIPVDVRVIAATNRKLLTEIESDRFREDLYHRLAVLGIDLPALRDRTADIADLARHFIRMILPEGESLTLSSAAIHKLERHEWTGNVREMRNVLQRAVLMRTTDVLGPDDINFSLSNLGNVVSARSQLTSRKLSEIERAAIIDTLVHHRGNRTESARALGISRSTLHRKLDEYQIEVDAFVRDSHGETVVDVKGPRTPR